MTTKTMLIAEGHLKYDRQRGVVYFFDKATGECLLRIEGVPKVPEGHQIDIHLLDQGGKHHHVFDGPGGDLRDGATCCAVKV